MKPICKDVEFARNLIDQMKEGYGRHNSNQAFNRNQAALTPRTPSLKDHQWDAMRHVWVDEPRHIGDARVVIKPDAQECEIGECFPFSARAIQSFPFLDVIRRRPAFTTWNPDAEIPKTADIIRMTFEKVLLVRNDAPPMLLWKRIE